jgi:hypothetical protein
MCLNVFRLFLICIILLSWGCNTIPTPISHEYQEQKILQAAKHWDILAADVANKINNELIRNDFLNASVYVKTTCGTDAIPCEPAETSQFNEGFRDLLLTQLVNYGIPTSTSIDRDVIVIDYKVQVILHSDGRVPQPPTGTVTGLTAAISVLRDAPTQLLAIAVAGAYDYYTGVRAMNSNYEIVITTSMVSKKKYIFRSSDIYYINDADFWHYQNPMDRTKEIQLTNRLTSSQEVVEETSLPDIFSSPEPDQSKDI